MRLVKTKIQSKFKYETFCFLNMKISNSIFYSVNINIEFPIVSTILTQVWHPTWRTIK